MLDNLNFLSFQYCFMYIILFFSGYINTKGMTFRKGTEKHTIVSAGPLTKYAEDLIPVIKAFLGPEKSLEFKIGEEVYTL